MVPSTTMVSAPSRWASSTSDAADLGHRAADGIERGQDAVGCGGISAGGSVDQPHLVDQAAIAVGETDDAGRRAVRGEGAVEPLDEPGAERVEPFELGEIDVDAARRLVAAGGVVDDLLELRGALGGPGAGCGERHALRRRPCAISDGGAQAARSQRPLSPAAAVILAPCMELSVRIERWPLAGAFTISRGTKTEAVVVVAELSDGTHRGRGESVPYARYGETPDGIVAAIEAMRPALRRGPRPRRPAERHAPRRCP